TSPRDVCRLSLTSSVFRSAARSELVWERFLQPDLDAIISNSVAPVQFASKKDLFFLLSDSHILLQGGTMSFSLHKGTGKKCYMLGATELSFGRVNSGCDTCPESRCLVVIKYSPGDHIDGIEGKMETHMLSPNTFYAAYFVFKLLGDKSEYYPVSATVKFIKGRHADVYDINRAYITSESSIYTPMKQYGQLARERKDGWMEIEMGGFFNGEGADGEVEMLLKGSRALRSSSTLIVQGIELRPK
ncbi:hypothetical protein NMG60_11017644, partial [Bertholletia excelsa]